MDSVRNSSPRTVTRLSFRFLLLFLLIACPAMAQPPAGYYNTVDTTNSTTLRTTLHEVIDDHTRFPYTSSSTDTWDILELADEDPNNINNILDVYKNASYAKQGGGNTLYNREHSWPKSYGFPNDVVSNYPFTDCHHLFLSDDGYNSSRSNKPYRNCLSGCEEKPTDFNNGQGGTPAESNWTSGSFTQGTWETWSGRRGDVARALFYMDVRYEGGTHGVTGHNEPDLILTDNESLIVSDTNNNVSVAYMGMLGVLLQWHVEDPVDDVEVWRNEVVYSFQGNRNPFIDHPEWVACVFSNDCTFGGDTTPPAAPTGLVASAGNGQVDLSWNMNSEGDLAGYNVYRSTASGGPFAKQNSSLVAVEAYSDLSVSNGTTYYYVVTAVDTSSNESAQSGEASATPTGGGGTPSGDPWINEFHYDNDGADTGEFVEIAGPAGLDLSGWQVLGYNGANGQVYSSISLSGTLSDQQGCLGTLGFAFSSMQNGSPDGLALVDPQGVAVQFLSYEGSFTALGGAAAGLISTDIGVDEPTNTPVGHSLQLGGTGAQYSDFTWQAAQANTQGQPNAGQTFDACVGDTTPPAAPTGLIATAGDGVVDLDWADNGEGDLGGYNVYRATSSGGPYSQLNGALLGSSAYSDGSASNGTTYFYVVTAVDTSANESALSNEASATPQDTTPPAAPTGLVATGADGQVDLDWADNGEPDLSGYNVYRATSSGGPYSKINGSVVGFSIFTDTGVTNGTTYYYVVTAVDAAANESAQSAEDSATPNGLGGSAGSPWINEIHYDNDGADTGEFVEIAGPVDTDLSGWTLLAYNGSNGAVYDSVNLSGIIGDQQGCFGTLSFAAAGLQNGSPDGLALVDPSGVVTEFISYEGSFTAVDGAAAGLTSTDIGVSQSGSDPIGHSLQLSGSGSQASDFTWQAPQSNTEGAPNAGQTFTGGSCADTTPPAAPTGLGATAGDGLVDLDWADNGEGDLASYSVYRSTTSGGPYSLIASGVVTSAYSDTGVTNGTTYYYVVTAVDTSSNESAFSAEVSATPEAPSSGPTVVLVDSIVPNVDSNKGNKTARVEVFIVDDTGQPISGATVTGTFTGDFNGTDSATTDASGRAVLTNGPIGGRASYTFCVDNVTNAPLPYDPAQNVETCDSI